MARTRENPTCFGSSLPAANIRQGPEACNGEDGVFTPCGGVPPVKVDYDTTLTSTGGFWGKGETPVGFMIDTPLHLDEVRWDHLHSWKDEIPRPLAAILVAAYLGPEPI